MGWQHIYLYKDHTHSLRASDEMWQDKENDCSQLVKPTSRIDVV